MWSFFVLSLVLVPFLIISAVVDKKKLFSFVFFESRPSRNFLNTPPSFFGLLYFCAQKQKQRTNKDILHLSYFSKETYWYFIAIVALLQWLSVGKCGICWWGKGCLWNCAWSEEMISSEVASQRLLVGINARECRQSRDCCGTRSCAPPLKLKLTT